MTAIAGQATDHAGRPLPDAKGDLYVDTPSGMMAPWPSAPWTTTISRTDATFRIPTVRLVEARAEGASSPTHQYLFTWASPAFGGVAGSCHALEIPFVFGVLANQGAELILGGPAAGDLWALSDAMQDAWLAFARTGDPNHPGLPDWPAWDPGTRPVMRFDVEPALVHDPGGVERELWEGLL